MATPIRHRDLPRLRKMALLAQGLLREAPFGRGLAAARKAVAHIGYVQIDTISVVERAHHHVLQSRVPDYQPVMLDQMLRERSIFEYWSHAAAFMPMRDYRFYKRHREYIEQRGRKWFRPKSDKFIQSLLRRIETEGPLRARDLENPKQSRSGWWDWKPAKRALEQLYFQGDLMVTDRAGFQKVYDLTERVLPADLDTTLPSYEEYGRFLLDQQLACHALVSRKGITYMSAHPELKSAVNAHVAQRVSDGELIELKCPDQNIYLCRPEQLEAKAPRTTARLKILSPFDNVVIQRERLESLFNFNYFIECYRPAAERQYGYFTLPMLYRGEFIGRVDCKAHRKSGVFEVRALHLEPDLAKPDDHLAQAFINSINEFSGFQGCSEVLISHSSPVSFAHSLESANAQRGDIAWHINTRNS